MGTFGERESLEDRYAWTKFMEWLEKGKWKVKRFRYAKEITSTSIDSLSLAEDQKIYIKKIFSTIDFDHDGIMTRGPETWLFDLKYKGKLSFKTWVNEDDYKAYYELSKTSGLPTIIVIYVYYNEDGTLHDKLYFHRVRDPKTEPKPIRFFDDRQAKWGGQKWVYEMPETEYHLITGFDFPYIPPKSLIDYYALCRKIEDAYKAWREGRKVAQRPDEDYKAEILREIERGYPKAWGLEPLEVPKKMLEPLRLIRERRKKLSKQPPRHPRIRKH